MYKKIISTFLTLCMVLTLLPLNALAAEIDQSNIGLPSTDWESNTDETETNTASEGHRDEEIISSGDCGATENNHVTWLLDSSGLLRFSGVGQIKDYGVHNTWSNGLTSSVPWFSHYYVNHHKNPYISNVIVDDGITSLGAFSFFRCSSTSITIPNTITSLGRGVFERSNIQDIYFDGNKKQWNELLEKNDNKNNVDLSSITIHYSSTESEDSVIEIGEKKIFNGHTYQLVYSTYGWNEMQSYCESQNGYLACITTAEEDKFLYNYINEYNVKNAVFGFTDDGDEGNWCWVSGEPTNYTNWNSNEPDNERGAENWGHYYEKYPDGTWNDCLYPENCHYLIEWNDSTDEDPPTGTKISLGEIPDDIYVGDSNRLANLFAINWTANDVGKTVHFQSSNPEVFQLVNTDITYQGGLASWTIFGNALSVGTSTVTITTSDGATANCEITVKSKSLEQEFDPEIYRANRLLDISNSDTASMADVLSVKTPCNIYIPLLQENGFEASATAWTVLTTTFDVLDSPSSLYDFAVEEKDIYSAIILELLEASKDYGVVDACDAIISDSKKIVSEVNMLLKTEYDINISNSDDWSILFEKDQELIKKVSEQFYKENYQADIASLDKVFSNFGKAIDIADCLETYVERISSAYALVAMSDSLKTVVRTMYQRCPSQGHEYLKPALADCVEIIDSSEQQLMADVLRFLARTYETSPAKPAASAYLSAIDVLFASRGLFRSL